MRQPKNEKQETFISYIKSSFLLFHSYILFLCIMMYNVNACHFMKFLMFLSFTLHFTLSLFLSYSYSTSCIFYTTTIRISSIRRCCLCFILHFFLMYCISLTMETKFKRDGLFVVTIFFYILYAFCSVFLVVISD